MRMSVDWSNLTFKATDVVKLVVFLIGFVFAIATFNNKLNDIIENQEENKKLFDDISKRFDNVGDRINNVEKDQLLLKQRVEAWENTRAYK